MSHSIDSRARRGRKLLCAVALACALSSAVGAGGCSSSTLPNSPGTAGARAGSNGAGGGAPGGSGGTGSGGGGAAGTSCATHRATPVSCPQSVASTMQTCQSDADCGGVMMFTTPGRCVSFNGQMQCSYDTCLSDDDCGARPATCVCAGQWFVYSHVAPGNGCKTGNCRDDGDCAGSGCAPSVGFGATFYGYVGYFCHTPQDQCRCDADCTSPLSSCAYNPEIGAWACASFGPAG